jgi:hypothetical protein
MRRGKEESESSQPAQTLHLATGSSNGLFGAKRLTLRAALKGVRRRCTPPSNALAKSPGGGPGESDSLERPHTTCGLDRKRSRRVAGSEAKRCGAPLGRRRWANTRMSNIVANARTGVRAGPQRGGMPER